MLRPLAVTGLKLLGGWLKLRGGGAEVQLVKEKAAYERAVVSRDLGWVSLCKRFTVESAGSRGGWAGTAPAAGNGRDAWRMRTITSGAAAVCGAQWGALHLIRCLCHHTSPLATKSVLPIPVFG